MRAYDPAYQPHRAPLGRRLVAVTGYDRTNEPAPGRYDLDASPDTLTIGAATDESNTDPVVALQPILDQQVKTRRYIMIGAEEFYSFVGCDAFWQTCRL